MVTTTGPNLALTPYARCTLESIPRVEGNVVIITCGDTRLFDWSADPVAEILEATGAPWGFLKTFVGGSNAFTSSVGGYLSPDSLARATVAEIIYLEELRGEPFEAVIDLAHLHCAGRGFDRGDVPIETQLGQISEGQQCVRSILGARYDGRPVYSMAFDAQTGLWW